MATNLHLDPQLIDAAVKAGKHKSKREAVEAALTAYVQSKKKLKIFELRGLIGYEPAYDYKSVRRKGRW
ncbi:MAG: type II toxin-antitoxin system VapB family antitoxin [Bryobacter sp.]|jgi:Arc/MetJ family transcription regulator|nr:type II toxin-antitoxin system VapB family antitoxin [Bryobacter sp.]